ncbi:MAG: citrate synthase [Planctomycetes bacterium]|nr:citrate synthase [Planctomycetota bacterium]
MADSLSVTDNRTGNTFELPIVDGAVSAMSFRQMKTEPDDFGLMVYDPAFKNTASCRSTISFIDGDKGILRHRGYPIEQLAEKSTYLEVAQLLINGELPTQVEHDAFRHEIRTHTFVHENMKKFIEGFRYDSNPMSMLISSIAALSSFYPEAGEVSSPEVRRQQLIRLIAKIPTLAAFAYRHTQGLPYVYPRNDLSYPANFLSMVFNINDVNHTPDPVLERAFDVLFILHADHEQNCSATAMRVVGSSQPDPYTALSAAAAALYGPLHGGANRMVLYMLERIGSVENIPNFIKKVKAKEELLMGFGHRVYRNYDPRARIIKGLAHEVFEVTGTNPLLDIAVELERIALEDDYFVERKLYPNVDFYSGLIYQAMKFPIDFYPVLFAIGRTAGWLSQWCEMLTDKEQKIARPRQLYVGKGVRDYVPVSER